MAEDQLRVLLVEDEEGIAELLRFTLESAGFAVAIAGNVAQAKQHIKAVLPHIVLLDWMLPDATGVSLLQDWRKETRTASLPVIMLTAKGLEEDKVTGLNVGADDYVTKPFSPKELVARVQALLRRKLPEVGHKKLTYGVLTLELDAHRILVGEQEIALDQAEFKLLRYLMAHPDRIYSRAELLDKVWGDHTFIEERTVDVHVMRLRKSLKEAADYLKTVRGLGYKLSQGA